MRARPSPEAVAQPGDIRLTPQLMRRKRLILRVAVTLAVLVGMPLGYYHLILDWDGRPVCHKQVNSAFRNWMEDRATNAFPNVDGVSRDSLAVIHDEMGGYMVWAQNYKYIPGLQQDDPGHLVLMYVNRPTRWTWHGPAPTVFEKRAWIVVPVDFAFGPRRPFGPGELSERVTPEEFKRRLTETIEFVRTNARPHWQTIVAEHTKFLESLEHVDR